MPRAQQIKTMLSLMSWLIWTAERLGERRRRERGSKSVFNRQHSSTSLCSAEVQLRDDRGRMKGKKHEKWGFIRIEAFAKEVFKAMKELRWTKASWNDRCLFSRCVFCHSAQLGAARRLNKQCRESSAHMKLYFTHRRKIFKSLKLLQQGILIKCQIYALFLTNVVF